jgi:hypothetical protein
MSNEPLPNYELSAPIDSEKVKNQEQRKTIISLVLGIVLVLGLIIAFLIFLLHPNTPEGYVARIRDVFIIIMAFESLLIGAVMVILAIQIANLTNLLQNEIKPILDSTNETISTLRGTTTFLSENISEPIIKLNEYMAGLVKLFDIIGSGKRKK